MTCNNSNNSLLHPKNLYYVTIISPKYYSVTHDYTKKKISNNVLSDIRGLIGSDYIASSA